MMISLRLALVFQLTSLKSGIVSLSVETEESDHRKAQDISSNFFPICLFLSCFLCSSVIPLTDCMVHTKLVTDFLIPVSVHFCNVFCPEVELLLHSLNLAYVKEANTI